MRYDGANITQLKEALREHGLSPNKKLGQNFLRDGNIADAIVRAAGDLADKTVVEIGPGAGALTVRLLEKAARVVAIELDAGLCRLLRARLDDARFTLFHADAMKIPLDDLALSGACVLVANLPYYATTPLLMRYLTQCTQVERFVLMMQREVAQRLCAQPGEKAYGSVSVAVRYHTHARAALDVAPSCFYPVPTVHSTVLVLDRREACPKPRDEDLLFSVVRASFAMRRKTLLNNLSAMNGLGREGAKQALSRCGIHPMARGETLSLEEFISLTDAVDEILRDKRE